MALFHIIPWDVSGLTELLQRLVLHILQRVNKAQITILAPLPFIHLVRWRTKTHNIALVKQNETLGHLSTPRIYPCPQTAKNFPPPFFKKIFLPGEKTVPRFLSLVLAHNQIQLKFLWQFSYPPTYLKF